jgi:hypothetical protein
MFLTQIQTEFTEVTRIYDHFQDKVYLFIVYLFIVHLCNHMSSSKF